MEISGDADTVGSLGTEEEKFTILSPYENLWVVDAMSLSLRKDKKTSFMQNNYYIALKPNSIGPISPY